MYIDLFLKGCIQLIDIINDYGKRCIRAKYIIEIIIEEMLHQNEAMNFFDFHLTFSRSSLSVIGIHSIVIECGERLQATP